LNWVRRVVTWHLTGTTPATHRLTWSVDEAARTSLEQEIFGSNCSPGSSALTACCLDP
jgi:hypothetical protein